jgi:hypothetical protein
MGRRSNGLSEAVDQKRGVKGKSVNREKHEKDKMTEDSNTHGSEES